MKERSLLGNLWLNSFIQICGGAQLRLIAFVTASEPVQRILTHRGGPSRSCQCRPRRFTPASPRRPLLGAPPGHPQIACLETSTVSPGTFRAAAKIGAISGLGWLNYRLSLSIFLPGFFLSIISFSISSFSIFALVFSSSCTSSTIFFFLLGDNLA